MQDIFHNIIKCISKFKMFYYLFSYEKHILLLLILLRKLPETMCYRVSTERHIFDTYSWYYSNSTKLKVTFLFLHTSSLCYILKSWCVFFPCCPCCWEPTGAGFHLVNVWSDSRQAATQKLVWPLTSEHYVQNEGRAAAFCWFAESVGNIDPATLGMDFPLSCSFLTDYSDLR